MAGGRRRKEYPQGRVALWTLERLTPGQHDRLLRFGSQSRAAVLAVVNYDARAEALARRARARRASRKRRRVARRRNR